jgi:hypothetical protein
LEYKDPTYKPLGATCVFLGSVTLLIASDYPYGTATAMGPGFVPTAVALILCGLGVSILLARGRDLTVPENGAEAKAEHNRPVFSPAFLRAGVCIGGAILLFGLAVKPLGLAVTVFLVVLLAGCGHPGARPVLLILLAVGLAVASCVIFVLLLGQEIPIVPRGA